MPTFKASLHGKASCINHVTVMCTALLHEIFTSLESYISRVPIEHFFILYWVVWDFIFRPGIWTSLYDTLTIIPKMSIIRRVHLHKLMQSTKCTQDKHLSLLVLQCQQKTVFLERCVMMFLNNNEGEFKSVLLCGHVRNILQKLYTTSCIQHVLPCKPIFTVGSYSMNTC